MSCARAGHRITDSARVSKPVQAGMQPRKSLKESGGSGTGNRSNSARDRSENRR